MERRRLIEAVLGRRASLPAGLIPAPDGGAAWDRHFGLLAKLLAGEANHG
jgi:hypothetical protein